MGNNQTKIIKNNECNDIKILTPANEINKIIFKRKRKEEEEKERKERELQEKKNSTANDDIDNFVIYLTNCIIEGREGYCHCYHNYSLSCFFYNYKRNIMYDQIVDGDIVDTDTKLFYDKITELGYIIESVEDSFKDSFIMTSNYREYIENGTKKAINKLGICMDIQQNVYKYVK